ncbi:DUF1127 domain-containing protein [Defluviimonas salinarum]|uniref:DUF1127 domain-containing protein n=1 Tax=Defluviimonas salinarum TaxID=2992147 RepID=A0ABT3J5G8_9RHOB|nr:DUF1127 domain-containing protein [Defluviimonas salinarum]MCW3782910.1 DUF1127 domain-containing protein [Defluviimonas salinarum]
MTTIAIGRARRRPNLFDRICAAFIRRRVFTATFCDLARLGDRELNDIGLSRGMIHDLAAKSADSEAAAWLARR